MTLVSGSNDRRYKINARDHNGEVTMVIHPVTFLSQLCVSPKYEGYEKDYRSD